MAVRSGAGTGVVVSLVVFVLTTVFLLVLTIVFYAGKTKETEAKVAVEETLERYIKRQEQSLDTYKNIEAASGRASVAAYLNQQYRDLMQFASGNESQTLDGLRTQLGNYGLADGQTIVAGFSDLSRNLTSAQSQIDGANSQLQDMQDQLAERDAQLAEAERAHQQELNNLRDEYQGYRDAAMQHSSDVVAVIDEYNAAKERLEQQYENRIAALQGEIDNMREQHVLDMARIDSLEAKISADRLTNPDPALLVDGNVMLVMGSDRTISIDRGSKDHITLGMTFEIYDDYNSILTADGMMNRGKASVRVIRVQDHTSTCKIVQEATGRPVVRGDVIVNAVYDPNYHYKFLVHGTFDLDGDGRPTPSEAEHIRTLIKDWGGEVVYGDTIPGDLDFLVLGIQPPNPPQPAQDAPPHVWDVWARQRQAAEEYGRLLRQATDAQIPVLNSNRFYILTGMTSM